jgi:hypothetical protein
VPEIVHSFRDDTAWVEANTLEIDANPDNRRQIPDEFRENGLIAAGPDGAVVAVLCATEVGRIELCFELWDGAPPLDAGAWQDIAEISVDWPGVTMDVGIGHHLNLGRPGMLRFRAYAARRDDGDVRGDGNRECILLQVWPQRRSSPEMLRAQSDFGHYARSPRQEPCEGFEIHGMTPEQMLAEYRDQ